MIRLLAALGMVAVAALPAQASLIGTQVRGELIGVAGNDVFASTPQPATVTDPGVEFSTARIAADFQADRLVLTLNGPEDFVFFALDYRFQFLAPTVVASASVLPGGTVAFLFGPRLSNNVLTFTNARTTIGSSGTASVTILLTTRTPDVAVPVPVPGALALFGAALLGLAGVARRRG